MLSVPAAQRALAVGAQFLVAPNTAPEVIAVARDAGRPIISGALTPTEVVAAWNLGVSAVKVFPIDSVGGPSYAKSLVGPLPHIPLVASGGVGDDDVAPYLAAGCAAVCVGDALVDTDAARRGDRDSISAYARAFLSRVSERAGEGTLPSGVSWSTEPGTDER